MNSLRKFNDICIENFWKNTQSESSSIANKLGKFMFINILIYHLIQKTNSKHSNTALNK